MKTYVLSVASAKIFKRTSALAPCMIDPARDNALTNNLSEETRSLKTTSHKQQTPRARPPAIQALIYNGAENNRGSNPPAATQNTLQLFINKTHTSPPLHAHTQTGVRRRPSPSAALRRRRLGDDHAVPVDVAVVVLRAVLGRRLVQRLARGIRRRRTSRRSGGRSGGGRPSRRR